MGGVTTPKRRRGHPKSRTKYYFERDAFSGARVIGCRHSTQKGEVHRKAYKRCTLYASKSVLMLFFVKIQTRATACKRVGEYEQSKNTTICHFVLIKKFGLIHSHPLATDLQFHGACASRGLIWYDDRTHRGAKKNTHNQNKTVHLSVITWHFPISNNMSAQLFCVAHICATAAIFVTPPKWSKSYASLLNGW